MIKFCQKCEAETERNARGGCKPCKSVQAAIHYKKNSDRIKKSVSIYQAANADKISISRAAAYIKNPCKSKARAKDWYKANTKRHRLSMVAWCVANPEKARAYSAAWRIGNKEVFRIYAQNRHAQKRANGGKLSQGLSAKLFKLQRGLCPCCKQPLGDNFHLDHIVPIKLGGANIDSNIQLLRQRCNNQKSSKDPLIFMQSKGFLL